MQLPLVERLIIIFHMNVALRGVKLLNVVDALQLVEQYRWIFDI